MQASGSSLVICEHCDAVYRKRALGRGESAHCTRCGAVLYRYQRLSVQTVLSLSLAGLIVLVMANVWPIVHISTGGIHADSTLWGAIMAVWHDHSWIVAVIVAITLFFAPLLQLTLLTWVCGCCVAGHRPPGLVPAVRILRWLHPWSMIEVLVLGILVAAVKLDSVFDVVPGIGMWSFAVLMVLVTLVVSWDTRALWNSIPGESL